MAVTDDLETGFHAEISASAEPQGTDSAGGKNRQQEPRTISERLLRAMQNPAITAPVMRKRLPKIHSSEDAVESAKILETKLTPAASENSEQKQERSRQWLWIPAYFRGFHREVKSKLPSSPNEEDNRGLSGKDKCPEPIDEQVSDFPRGFPRLSAVRSSDDDYMIFRSFKRPHVRILSQMEVEITKLADDWDELDRRDNADPEMWHRLFNTEDDKNWDPQQRKIFELVKMKLKEYDEILLSHAQIQGLGRPPSRNYQSLYNWVVTKRDLSPVEYQNFIRHESDFVSGIWSSAPGIRHDRGSSLGESIRSHLAKNKNSPLTWFIKNGVQHKPGKATFIDTYSPYKFGIVYRVVVISLSAGMILVPVFLLFLLSLTRVQMAMVVLVFVLLFGVVMDIVTNANTAETFMAVSAYGAVLVAFLGNLSSKQSCVSVDNST